MLICMPESTSVRIDRETYEELEICWERAVNHEPPGTIEPLP
jgi:hypothetical protein